MDWHPIQGGGGVEILLVTSCYRNWNECWPDGLLETLCRLDFHRLSCHLHLLVQNVSHENHLIFMQMTVQVAYIFILIVRTKTRFATEAKETLGLGYSSMSCLGSL